MGFSCCASDPIFSFAALEILTLVLLLIIFFWQSPDLTSNSCPHRGLTSILLLHPCTEDIHGKGREIPLSICLLICSLIAGTLLQLTAALSTVLSWSPGNKPEGLVHAPVSLEGSSRLQNTQGCKRLSPPSHSKHAGLVPSRTEFSLKLTPPPRQNQKLLNDKAKLEIVNNGFW